MILTKTTRTFQMRHSWISTIKLVLKALMILTNLMTMTASVRMALMEQRKLSMAMRQMKMRTLTSTMV